jgi:hypothetical protein
MAIKPTPKTYRKSNKTKKVRVCKSGAASEAIGTIEKNIDIFCLTYGQFSLIDALVAILDQTGPAHVCISTWTAAHVHLDRSMELMNSADILSLRMIVDRSFKTRQPQYFNHMIELFGADSIREIRTHAKFMTIRNDKFDIVVKTSMNLNENPRLENIEISENAAFADFFEEIVNAVFEEVGKDESKSALLDLQSIKDSSPFKQIQAIPLKRSDLNEAGFTHTLKN